MPTTNRQFHLAARPVGVPKPSDFKLVSTPVPPLQEGEFLIRTTWISVDPYMRGRMNDRKSYIAPFAIGEVIPGGAVGQVVESRNDKYKVGDAVTGMWGWQECAVSRGEGIYRVQAAGLPESLALGVLGMPGFTAYFGLLDIGQPKAGETVVISGGAGAVGSLVGQIAKIKGCRTVGIAGGDDKVDWMTKDLGFDAAFNYRTVENYTAKLAELCPNGIDVYFDNVGGPITDAVFPLINNGARIVVCGQISLYNATELAQGPRVFWKLIEKQARIEGFLVFQFASRFKEAAAQIAEWIQSGEVKYRETIVDGFENTPSAFLGMLEGDNIGKQLVRVTAT